MMSKIIIALYVLTTSSALVILKLSAKNGAPISLTDGKLAIHFSIGTMLGVMLYGLSFILYTYLISSYNLGYIIPLSTAFVYIFIFLASFVIFNEVFTIVKVAGIALIVVGLILLNLKK